MLLLFLAIKKSSKMWSWLDIGIFQIDKLTFFFMLIHRKDLDWALSLRASDPIIYVLLKFEWCLTHCLLRLHSFISGVILLMLRHMSFVPTLLNIFYTPHSSRLAFFTFSTWQPLLALQTCSSLHANRGRVIADIADKTVSHWELNWLSFLLSKHFYLVK